MLFYTHFKKIFEEQNVIPIKLTSIMNLTKLNQNYVLLFFQLIKSLKELEVIL